MYLIRDGRGHIFNQVENPTAVYDVQLSVLLKIGEKETMEQYYHFVRHTYRSQGYDEMANDICLMELPKDQEEIDKVFQICDYIGKLHRRMVTH